MRIAYADTTLALLETDQAGMTQLPVAAIKSARRRLTVLRAAKDDLSLKNWKSLHYETMKGNREGQRSVRVNNEYRMVFNLDEETDPQTITVLMIEGYL
jgi:proteic killer suppression protein